MHPSDEDADRRNAFIDWYIRAYVQEQIVSRFGDCRRNVMRSFDDDQQELCLGSSLVDFSFSRWVSHLSGDVR
jgi:hypothetical protein